MLPFFYKNEASFTNFFNACCDLNASSIGVYTFNDWDGPKINVFYAHPEVLNDKTRLVIVMHGRKRNAEQYRNQWIDSAREKIWQSLSQNLIM